MSRTYALSHSPVRAFCASVIPLLVLRAVIPLSLCLAVSPSRTEDAAGQWRPAGVLSEGRYAPGAALLPDGRVVMAGGYSFETDRTLVTSDIFDPAAGTWSEGPRLRFDRNFPLVLGLPNGDSLFVAGFRRRGGTTATVERLDARALTFRESEPAQEERELFAATPMADGRVLITGGYSTTRRKTLDSAEIYDPRTGRFTGVAARMGYVRFGHTGVLLPNGRVLIVGGKVLMGNLDVLPAELFDPATGRFTETGSLSVSRDRCSAWVLPDGKRVLVAGGSAHEGGTVPARRSEIYDISAGKFNAGPELVRDRMAHTTTMLAGGRVLLTSGWSTSENATTRQAELWDPKAERFLSAGLMQVGRHDHAAVLLKDGRVLVAGGKEGPARNGVETPLPAEIWSP